MSENEQFSQLNEDRSLEMTTKPHTISADDDTTAEANHHAFKLTEDKDLVDSEGIDAASSCNNQTQQLTSVVEVSEDETHPKGLLNESNSALDATARQFRNGFFELVEELKLRRTLDNENEKHIKTLFSEKSQMHQKWEEEVSQKNVQKNVHEKEMKDITKQFEERLHQHEIDKAKDDLAVQCNMKEMNQLKDEIRALHLAKYSIEKRASELDRELQIQAIAREHHVKQLTEIEKKYHEAISQTHEAFDLVNKVEINVGAAVRLHKKLSYYNEHQKCQLNSYKQGLDSKQHEMASLKILVENLKASLRTAEDNGHISEQNEKDFRMQAELCRHLQSQLNEARKENKNLIDSLKEAHNLVDRHVGIANKHSELESLAQFELDEVKSECENLKNEVGELTKSHETMQHETAERLTIWNTEKEQKDKELVDTKSRYEALTHAHNTLEDNNYKLGQQIEEMKKEMDKLLCSEKEKAEALADTSLLIEKMKAENQNQIHELQKQLAMTRLQVLEESNSVKDWKEKFAAKERKAEELEVNLTETMNQIKHKEANRHSQLTQTEGLSLVQLIEKEENTDNIESARNKDQLKAENEHIPPGVSANTTYSIENVNLPMPCAESILNTSDGNADTTGANSIALDDDKRDVTLAGGSKEVIIGTTSVLAKNSITVVANNGEESILESREDRGSSTVNGHSDTILQCVKSTETTQHITSTSNETGVSIEDVSGEIEKVNPAFLTTASSCESLVKDNKERASQETRKDIKCSTTVQAESVSTILPLLSQPKKKEMEGREEEKMKFKQSSQTSTLVVYNTFPLKSCLREKSLAKGLNPRVYKKLRFNLPTNESLTNVLPSLDKNVLEGDKNQSLLQEGLRTKMGYPGIPKSTNIYLNVNCKTEMQKAADKEEQESCREGIEAQMEPKLTHIMASSNDGTSLSKSCEEHSKTKSEGCNGNNKCSTSGNSDDQELFSDEDEGQTVIKCQDVGQQIKRIQQFLNNERLTTSRKRKFPDDSHS